MPQPRDRQWILALLIAAAVLIPRGIFIVSRHSLSSDETYHLFRGLVFLRRDWNHMEAVQENDHPPVGEALIAIPAWINGVRIDNPFLAVSWSRDVPPPRRFRAQVPQSVRIETAIWKSILFLPAIAVIFHWTRKIYSAKSAWLAVAMVLVDPTFAAHIPLLTLDALEAETILLAAWAAWRFFAEPTTRWQLIAAASMALAMVVNFTALIMPIVALVMAAVAWMRPGRPPGTLKTKSKTLLLTAALVPLFIWALLLGDISVPRRLFDEPIFVPLRMQNLLIPCGSFLESIWVAHSHVLHGHHAALLGQISESGWWYYFPVVATYKIPIGIGMVMLLALLSLAWIKPRFEEWPLLICALALTGLSMVQNVDVGFRHFLPAMIFFVMPASRIGCSKQWICPALAWLALTCAAIDTLRWAPDFLSFINFPRQFVYLDISDSNIDWGQANLELRRWIDLQPDDGRPIYLAYFGAPNQDLFDQLGPRLTKYMMITTPDWISRTKSNDFAPGQIPTHGILILSPVWVSGQYDFHHVFADFKSRKPDEVIGRALLVYDLDKLKDHPRLNQR